MDATANNPDRVRQRAFQLWEQRGNPEGYELSFGYRPSVSLRARTLTASQALTLPPLAKAAADQTARPYPKS